MITCALAEIRRVPVSMPRRLSPSSSSLRTRGSITTPLPITHSVFACRIPLGIRCSLNVSPSRMIVWPALLPPWKRITASARSASRSVTFPFPSSPHWAPTITIVDMTGGILGGGERRGPAVLAPQRNVEAHVGQPGHGAVADLLAQLVALEVGGDDDRALLLIADVDDRVELFQHPGRRVLGPEVVEGQEVDRGETVQQLGVAVLRALAERRADLGEQA